MAMRVRSRAMVVRAQDLQSARKKKGVKGSSIRLSFALHISLL